MIKNRIGIKAAGIILAVSALSAGAVSSVSADALSADSKTGDTVTFGSYTQETGDAKQELEWKVLDRDGDDFLLLSDKCLAAMPYQTSETADGSGPDTTWEECSLRQWLNQVFIAEAFSEEEQNKLIEKTIVTKDNEEFDTTGGADTTDKVFLLSGEEALEYLKDKKSRMAEATEAAREGEPEIFVSELTDASFWWLRSPGGKQNCVQVTGAEGAVSESGFLVSRTDIGVRPAIWVNLNP